MAINALPSRPGGGPPPPGMGGMPPMPMGQPGMLPPNLMLLANQGMPQNMLGRLLNSQLLRLFLNFILGRFCDNKYLFKFDNRYISHRIIDSFLLI